jgi:hypothetical protein
MKNLARFIALAALLPACSGGADDDDTGTGWDGGDTGTGDSGLDGGGDAGPDAGSDTEGCTPVAWGGGLTTGAPVANWSLDGYADRDGDGVVETTAVPFDLEDIHCAHKRALVVIIGDTA